MKFCLLKHDGTYRFYNQDPFEYIKKKGFEIIKDYYNKYYCIEEDNILNEIDRKYSIIFFGNPSLEVWKDSKPPIKNIAASKVEKAYIEIFNELNRDYKLFPGQENHYNVYQNAMIVKNDLTNFDKEEIKELRRMIKDALEWF